MKKIIKIAVSLTAIVLLNACSSSTTTSNEDNSAADVASNNQQQAAILNIDPVESDMPLVNGLGETQVERYKLQILPTVIDIAPTRNLPVSKEALSNSLSHAITTALNKTHRFDILAISDWPLPEANQTESEQQDQSAPTESKTDYYLKSTLNQLDITETVRILKATGQGVEEKHIVTSVLYQIIDAKNDKVVFSRTLNYQLKSTTNNETFKTTINHALENVAGLIKNEIINEIYPMRILNTDNGQILIDQPLTVGTQCEIIQVGKKINDAYSNSLLGYEQNVIGRMIITKTTSVIAYGELITGEAHKGNICKPLVMDAIVAPELIKRTQQGGVVLPFD